MDSVVITDNLDTRTRTSVDFSIPAEAPLFRPLPDNDPSYGVYYLPVAVLAKWPPLANFDLRDESGASVPRLTRRTNRGADAAALRSLVPGRVTPERTEVLDALARSVEGDVHEAHANLQRFTELLLPLLPNVSTSERIMWALVKGWVSVLSTNSLLWVPVTGRTGERRVFKFAFEQRLDSGLHFWKRVEQSFSFAAAFTSISVPQIAAYRSYHLQFEAPPDLQVVSAQLRVDTGPASRTSSDAPPEARGLIDDVVGLLRRFARWATHLLEQAVREGRRSVRRYRGVVIEREDRHGGALSAQLEPQAGTPYSAIMRRRAHLHVSEPARSHPVGGVQIGLRAAREGVITGTFVASVLIATLMTVFALMADTVAEDHLPAGVTILVLVPGLIGYLAVRPGEHPLLRRHVRSVRILLLLAASVPITAAVLLVAISGDEPVQLAWGLLALVSWGIAAVLAISWLLPGMPSSEP